MMQQQRQDHQQGMKRRQGRWPAAAYKLNRWPASVRIFESLSFSQPRQNHISAALVWAGLPATSRGLKALGLRAGLIRRLLPQAAANRHGNSYHNPAHTLAVIRAAGLLAEAAGLSKRGKAILVLAALVHDLDHMGRYQRAGLAEQEFYSFKKTAHLMTRYAVHPDIQYQLLVMVLATCPQADEDLFHQAGEAGDMVDCLVDADLFQSLFTKPAQVDRLTKNLKLEMGVTQDWRAMRDGFIASRQRVGLHSAAGRFLHSQLPDKYTYYSASGGQG